MTAVLLAPIAPTVEHAQLDRILGPGREADVLAGDGVSRVSLMEWTGQGCESRFELIARTTPSDEDPVVPDLAVGLDWSRIEKPATTPGESTLVRLDGPFATGSGPIDRLTITVASAADARAAADAINRLRATCRPQR